MLTLEYGFCSALSSLYSGFCFFGVVWFFGGSLSFSPNY